MTAVQQESQICGRKETLEEVKHIYLHIRSHLGQLTFKKENSHIFLPLKS